MCNHMYKIMYVTDGLKGSLLAVNHGWITGLPRFPKLVKLITSD